MNIEIVFYSSIFFLLTYMIGILFAKPEQKFARLILAISWYAFFITVLITIHLYTSSIWITIISIPIIYFFQIILQLFIGGIRHQFKRSH